MTNPRRPRSVAGFSVRVALAFTLMLASALLIADLWALESGGGQAKGRGGRLLSELRSLDYEALAAGVASALGVDPSRDTESFYLVYLSGRSLRLDPASVGAVGVEATRIGFAAFVPGRGWVPLPCRVYDDEVYVNGTVVSLLDGGRVGPGTTVEVKLPTLRPVEAEDLTGFPEAFRGARGLYRVAVEHPGLGTLAVFYVAVGLVYDASYCIQHGGTDRPSGYSAHQQPFLALEAVGKGLAAGDPGLAERVELLAVAAAFNPVDPSRLGVRVHVEELRPVPGRGAPGQYYTAYDVRAAYPYTGVGATLQQRLASPGKPAVFNLTLIDDEMYPGLAWRRVIAFVGFAGPRGCQGRDAVGVTLAGQAVFEGTVADGDVVRVSYDAGPRGSFSPWVLVEVSPSSCAWNVSLERAIVEYALPQVYASDYSEAEQMEYRLVFLPDGDKPLRLTLEGSGGPVAAAIAYPLPLLMYGGIGAGSSLEVRALMMYRFSGPLAPSMFPVTVKYYVGGMLACVHKINYTDVGVNSRYSGWCRFSLKSEELVNGLHGQWPALYVVIVVRPAGPPEASVTLEVGAVFIAESGLEVRRLNHYSLSSGNPVHTSMVPSDSTLWSRMVRFVGYAATYATAYQPPGGQSGRLGMASLTLIFGLQRIFVPVCVADWVASSSDWTLAEAVTSRQGRYIVEYSGHSSEFEVENVDLRVFELTLYYGDGLYPDYYEAGHLGGVGAPGGSPQPPAAWSSGLASVVAFNARQAAVWALKALSAGYSVYENVSASDGVLVFRYEAGSRADLADYKPMPQYGFAFTSGCGAYDVGWSFRAVFEGGQVGRLELGDSGTLARSVASAG